jgi:hypothetical protein
MEIELIKHSIVNIIGNLVTYFFLALMVSWIISACFGIKNDMMPFGWVKKVFIGLKPLFNWLFEKLQLLAKILFKWFIYAVEQLFILLVELFRKLFELLRNPDD